MLYVKFDDGSDGKFADKAAIRAWADEHDLVPVSKPKVVADETPMLMKAKEISALTLKHGEELKPLRAELRKLVLVAVQDETLPVVVYDTSGSKPRRVGGLLHESRLGASEILKWVDEDGVSISKDRRAELLAAKKSTPVV
jgi:hypothetical protein